MSSQHDSSKEDSREATAVDAIATVSDEGKRIRWKLILATVTLIVSTAAIGAFVIWPPEEEAASAPPAVTNGSVAVLLPDDRVPPRDASEPCVQALTNAERQRQGFDHAFSAYQNEGIDDLYIGYCLDLLNSRDADTASQEAERVLSEVKKQYTDKGVRIFLITMSSAVDRIKPRFDGWSRSLDATNRPVLIATVASAPGIADLEQGILRHYIRSKDESELLSNYIESLQSPPKLVGVFYVTDKYGIEATELLKLRLKSGENFETYPTNAKPDAGDIDDFVRDFIREQEIVRNENLDTPLDELVFAVIVGYGEMISTTLTSLMNASLDVEGTARQFSGQVLPVSTFTEESWRPPNLREEFEERIRTIGTGIEEDIDDRKGVVFQFSAMTLDRALVCRNERGIDSFWECWKKDTTTTKLRTKKWADVEYMADGDSRVELRMLDHDAWSE